MKTLPLPTSLLTVIAAPMISTSFLLTESPRPVPWMPRRSTPKRSNGAHRRPDGAGYPRGLKGNDIPIEGRIVAVADVYDALTHERPYKEAWPVDRALEELRRGARTQFDPDVLDAFMTVHETQGESLGRAPAPS